MNTGCLRVFKYFVRAGYVCASQGLINDDWETWLSIALKRDGSVWTHGFLGGLKENWYNFVQVIPSGAVDVAVSECHAIVLKADGSVWTAGCNYWGQLGDGTFEERDYYELKPLFQQVTTNGKAVAAGPDQSLVLKQDGSVWLAGWNPLNVDVSTWKLYSPRARDAAAPNFVQVFQGAQAISVGHCYSMVLDQSGALWAAGRNENGQLGDGSIDFRNKFVRVLSDVQTMAAGKFHSLAVKNDGSVWGTGSNYLGAVGLGILAPAERCSGAVVVEAKRCSAMFRFT